MPRFRVPAAHWRNQRGYGGFSPPLAKPLTVDYPSSSKPFLVSEPNFKLQGCKEPATCQQLKLKRDRQKTNAKINYSK